MKDKLICIDNQDIKPDDLPYIFVTQFNDDAVKEFYKGFLAMQANSKVRVIPLVISSYGGQCHALLSMLDLIESSSKPVATIALGKAMSCGAWLLSFGTRGYRYAAPNADIMLHQVSSMEWGKVTDVKNGTEHVVKLNDFLFKKLARTSTNKKDDKFLIKELRKRENVDWFLSAQEYKKLGLIDHVCVPSLVRGAGL